MGLATFDELKQSVIDQTHRNDLDLKMDDFVTLAENEMRANEDEPLNIRANELISSTVAVVDSALVPLPTNYQSSRSLRITLGETQFRIVYQTPANMVRRNGSGDPCFYTIFGDNIQFDINAKEAFTVTFEYESDLTPLAELNQTNNILTKYPNVYLFGALKQAFAFAEDDEQTLKYHSLFMDAITATNNAEKLGRFGDSPSVAVGWAP